MKRLGIYSFYEQDGIVDSYVTFFLNDLKENVDELAIICNGKLTAEGRKAFEEIASVVVVRENQGFDIAGYLYGMKLYGWERLSSYDEVVLANNTMMGPIYPFSEMFAEMAQRKLDFWGITRHYKIEFDPFQNNPYGYIPEHLQSYFMVFRKNFVASYEFQEYWDSLPELKTYEDAVGKHETYFTKYFEEKGYVWDSYVDTSDMEYLTNYPLMNYPKVLIEKKKCPIFKRRTFFQPYEFVTQNTTGQAACELYDYLVAHTNYDVNMIWDNILRTCNQADFVKNLQLNYTLSTSNCHREQLDAVLMQKKIALIMHLYFPDLLEESLHYAMAMPESADVYITTNTEEKKLQIEKVFSSLKCHHLEVRVIENRGRDVSSILVGVKDVISQYEYACFVHDKKTAQISPGSVGESFAYKLFENTLHNQNFVYNVIETFEKNPRLGILSPPEPNHAHYYPILGCEWGGNYEITVETAKKLGLKGKIEKDKPPVAPYGTFFWFRPAAFHRLYAQNWDYSDFPKEPNGIDGTLLHAIERLYSIVVQEEGYYPAVLMSDTFARIEYTNLRWYLREYNCTLAKYGWENLQYKMIETVNGMLGENASLKAQVENLKKEKQNYADYVKYLEEEVAPKASLSYQLKHSIGKFLPFHKK
ncbi:MAG: rhamnan synthesis F family protein [bacterium]|nr:rhamnan synthesis F family protein [bacterium]